MSARVGVSATVLADSLSEAGHRLTTIEVTFHRFVLAEFNTHRVFSRNSASSRAIPVSKQIDRVQEFPAVPVVWPTEQKGMSGGEPLGPEQAMKALDVWLSARGAMVEHALMLVELGVHKSVVNRLLEPFMWHTVIVTSTCWDNFWCQRVSPLAQPEIMVAATAMREAYLQSVPEILVAGEWHLPLVSREEKAELDVTKLRRLSAARCARTSYLTHAGVRSLEADYTLFERLESADPMHASPLEHVATPCSCRTSEDHQGNFVGWDQFRHEVEALRTIYSYT